MKVNLFATLRAIAGQKTIDLDAEPGVTAIELVELLVQRYPALRHELLDGNNEFHRHQKFFINGREAVYMEAKMDTPIQADDRVDIFPPVGGG